MARDSFAREDDWWWRRRHHRHHRWHHWRRHRHWDDDDNTGFPYKHCGALAVGEKAEGRLTSWGSETAQTRREAEDLTLQACERTGQKCKIREWVCT